MSLNIKPCLLSDLETLRSIGYETYDDTFRAMNTPETMDAYLADAFNLKKLRDELTNPDSRFYFLYVNGELAGYFKLNIGAAQTDLQDPEALELERIYVRKGFQGQGLGRVMLDYAVRTAHDLGKRYVWLGVWEKNTNAIAFYQKMGFAEAGRHGFRMGDEVQTDYILKRVL